MRRRLALVTVCALFPFLAATGTADTMATAAALSPPQDFVAELTGDRLILSTRASSPAAARLAPAGLTVERRLVLEPVPPQAWRDRWPDGAATHPMVQLSVKNRLGEPLPAGMLRVFQTAPDGGAIFLGEDRLETVPVGETARLALGPSREVTIRRSQTDFTRLAAEVTEAAWQVQLRNDGDAPARVTVRERFSGDWLVVEESVKHVREDAHSAAWSVTVPAKGEAVLRYRARVKGALAEG